MPGTPPDRERLLALASVHTVAPHPDEGTVVLGVAPDADHDALPNTARVDGASLRVVIETRPRPESLGRALRRARAADRAASAGYHPHVPAGFLRRHVERTGGDPPPRSDGGLAAKPPDSDGEDGSADARTGPRDAQQRPLASGLQVGPGDGSFGTLGPPIYVADASRIEWASSVSEGDILLATNRHVLPGSIGDPVYQPAVQDSNYRIGELAGFVPLESGTHADIAAIKLDAEEQIEDYAYWDLDAPDQAIQRTDYFDTIASDVTLSGGNSGVVTGTLQATDVSTSIDYDDFGSVTVNGIDETNDISQGGDSGSQRFNAPDAAMLDLNFASDSGFRGSDDHAWGCTVDACEREMGVRFLRSMDVRNLTGNLGAGSGGGYYAQNGAYYAAGGAYTSPDPETVETVTSTPAPAPGESDPAPSTQPGGDGTGTGNPPFGFDRVLDAVDDLGMDNTGVVPTDPAWDFRDGTLIDFPPGEYLIEGGFNTDAGTALTGLSNWGIRGQGATRDDVAFTTVAGEARSLWTFGSGCENIYVANCSLDQSNATATSVRMNLNGEGGYYLYNIQQTGYQPNDNECGPPDNDAEVTLIASCTDSGRTAEVINYKNTVDTTVVSYPSNGSAMATYQGHQGTIYLRNAWIANKGEHAYYASRPEGNVRIEGGLFENCANTNMRICGSGSWARDATVRVDRDASYFVQADDGVTKPARLLRWESGGNTGGATGGFIQGCDFVYLTEKNTPGALVYDGNVGAMDMINCRIHSKNSSGPVAITRAFGSGPDGITPPSPNGPVVFDGCDFTGDTTHPPIDNSARAQADVEADGSCNGLSSGYTNVTVSNPSSTPCDDPTQ